MNDSRSKGKFKHSDEKGDLTSIDDLPEFEHDESGPEEVILSTDGGFDIADEEMLPPEFPILKDSQVSDYSEDLKDLQDTQDLQEAQELEDIAINEEEFVLSVESHGMRENIGDFNDFNEMDEVQAVAETQKLSGNDTIGPPKPDMRIIEIDEPEDFPAVSPVDQAFVEYTRTNTRESFTDLRKFSNAISYGHIKGGGNPAFSLLLKGLRFKEEAEQIMDILNEFGLISSDTQQSYRNSLSRGVLLISQISEFAAVFLAHKLRRFHVEIKIGPADAIHPSTATVDRSLGLVSKDNLYQNVKISSKLKSTGQENTDILTTTSQQLEGHHILRYLGVVTEHLNIAADLVKANRGENRAKQYQDHYKKLLDLLKSKTSELLGNAILGIQYQVTPLIDQLDTSKIEQYQLTIIGNAAVVTSEETVTMEQED